MLQLLRRQKIEEKKINLEDKKKMIIPINIFKKNNNANEQQKRLQKKLLQIIFMIFSMLFIDK